MNETYIYPIGASVWTVTVDSNIVENWIVQMVTIIVAETANTVTYVLHNKHGSASFLEANIYATLNDALLTLE
jgi:hypothetical protein